MEKQYKNIRPDRETRLFKQPISIELKNCELLLILNKHHIHTDTLRFVFGIDDQSDQQLLDLWNRLPVGEAPTGQPGKVSINVGRYWDAKFDSYSRNGSLASVQQWPHPPLMRGQQGLTATFQVHGTDSKGLLTRLNSVTDSQGVKFIEKS